MSKASGFLAIGIGLCIPPDLTRKKCESAAYGTKKKIIETIHAMHKKHLPLYAPYVMDNHIGILSRAASIRFLGQDPGCRRFNDETTHKKALQRQAKFTQCAE
jgi:hypothetical protein